jgi:hypothetical protein
MSNGEITCQNGTFLSISASVVMEIQEGQRLESGKHVVGKVSHPAGFNEEYSTCIIGIECRKCGWMVDTSGFAGS